LKTRFSSPRCFRDPAILTVGKAINKEIEKEKRGLNMAAEIASEILTDEEYADAEYRRFLREKDKYVDFDEFCRQEGI
jgi:hypothetical protein